METRSNNLLVGAVTLALLVATALFAVWLANSRTGARTDYDIFFRQSINGLARGSQVVFSGVPAGQVKEIALWRADPGVVRVRIEVDEQIPILEGTTAKIESVGFTGPNQIALEGATRGAPPIARVGRAGVPEIPPKVAGLGAILNSAPELLDRISLLTERLTALADDRNAQSLAQTLDNVEATTGALARSTPRLEAVLGETQLAVREAGRAASAVTRLADQTGGTVQGVRADIDPAMRDLRTAIASANRSIVTLEDAIRKAEPGLDSFSSTTIPEANALIRDLRRTSGSISTLSERLGNTSATSLITGERLPDYEPAK